MPSYSKPRTPKSRIIAFVGLVGTGKSTHMRLLAEYLKSRGFKVRMSLLKVGNLWAWPLYKLASMGLPIFKRKYLFKLWVVLDVFAISLKFLVFVWIPLRMGYTLLIEEYLPAIVADYIHIARINGHSLKYVRIAIAFMYRLAKLLPFTSVFLDADYTTLKKRWRLRGSPDEKVEYLLMQRTLLFSIAKSLSQSLIYINTAYSTIKEVHHMLIEKLVRQNYEGSSYNT